MKRPEGNNDWYYQFVQNVVIEKNNERTTAEKIHRIFSMICLLSMRKGKRWQEEKPEKQ